MLFRSVFSVLPSDMKKQTALKEVLDLVQRNAAFELNARQVHKYLAKYANISGEIPKSTFQELSAILQKTNTFLLETREMLIKLGGQSELAKAASMKDLLLLQDSLNNTERYFLEYLSQAKALCRSLWAKFDFNLIFVGISLLLTGIAVVVVAQFGVRSREMALITFVGLGVPSAVTSLMFNFLVVIPSFVFGLLILGGCVHLWRQTVKRTEATARSFFGQLSIDNFLALVLFSLQCVSMFSNSFVVNEDKLLGFFIQALVTIKCIQILWKSRVRGEKLKLNTKHNFRKSSKKDKEKLTAKGSLLKLSFAWLVFEIANRTAVLFKACREEQLSCTPSEFVKPLSALTEKSSAASSRVILALFCTCVIPLSIRQWLQYQGNLNGRSLVVLCAKYFSLAACGLIFFFRALEALPQDMSSVFPEVTTWHQIILPQMVYWLCIATIVCLLYSPLCIFTVIRDKRHSINETVSTFAGTKDGSKMIHALVKELKQNWKDLNDDNARDDENTPLVYGLATVYSSSILVLFLAVVLPLMMLLGSGMSLSVTLLFLQMFLLLEIQGIDDDVRSEGSDIIGSGLLKFKFEKHLNPLLIFVVRRSEERRVGKECRSRWSPYH